MLVAWTYKLIDFKTHSLHHAKQDDNTAVSILNLEDLLFFQNLSQFKSSQLIHVLERTNGSSSPLLLPAPVLIMTPQHVLTEQVMFLCY